MTLRSALLAFLALSAAAGAKPRVVATTSDLGAIARELAGEDASVEVLARPTQDPHFVDAKPNLVVSLNRADLLLLTGMDLEQAWLPVLLTGARNGRIQKGAAGYLDASALVTARDLPQGKVDRSMGDIHPGGNPHYLKDPRNGLRVGRGIAERLAALDPSRAEAYRGRAARFGEELERRIAGWEKRLAHARGKPIVTYHRSWSYFTEWLGLEQLAHVEPKPGLAPSTGHVTGVVQAVRRAKAPLILQEDWYEAATSELIAKASGAKLVRVPGMPGDRQSYGDYIESLVDGVARALPGSGP